MHQNVEENRDFPETHEVPTHKEMTGTRDGQKLADALDGTEQD
jgi:hypothetical protein